MKIVRYAKKRVVKAKRNYKKRPAKRSAPVRQAQLKSVVAKAVRRASETKNQVYSGNVNVSGYNTNQMPSQILPVSPYNGLIDIEQGVGQGNRVGNKIRIKRLTMSYILSPLQYNATTNATPAPQEFKIWFFKSKEKVREVVASTDLASFFQDGNTTITPVGNLNDLVRPTNSDDYTHCTSRRHKVGAAIYGGTGTNASVQSFANNDFKLNVIHTVDLTKWAHKNVTFDDTDDNPTSPLLQCWFECMDADGATAAAGQIKLRMDYTIKCWYSDN